MDKPEDRSIYKIKQSWAGGDFYTEAVCKHYKCTKSLSKGQKKYGYRWIEVGTDKIINHRDVEGFEFICKQFTQQQAQEMYDCLRALISDSDIEDDASGYKVITAYSPEVYKAQDLLNQLEKTK